MLIYNVGSRRNLIVCGGDGDDFHHLGRHCGTAIIALGAAVGAGCVGRGLRQNDSFEHRRVANRHSKYSYYDMSPEPRKDGVTLARPLMKNYAAFVWHSCNYMILWSLSCCSICCCTA